MFLVDRQRAPLLALLPQLARPAWLMIAAHLHGQVQPQPAQGSPLILMLAAALAGFGVNARRLVGKLDRAFGFVAMLSAWPGAAASLGSALSEQRLVFHFCRVGRGLLICGHKRIVHPRLVP